MTFTAPILELSSKRTFMSSGLTFEIWHYISRFIPDDQLYKLYPVNRAFFYIAMPLRYNRVSLSGQGGFTQNVDAGKYVGVIEAPSLGKHVHTLTFNLTEYGPTDSRIAQLLYKEELLRIKAFAPLSKYLYALCHPIQRRKTRKFKAQLRKTKAFIASLDQLTSLVVQWYQDCPVYLNYNIYTDIFLLGWSTFGARLRSLSLHMTTDSFPYLFVTELYLPQLDTLTLDLHKRRDDAGSFKFIRSSPTTPFIKLIRRHFKTLTSLRIVSLSSLDRKEFYAGIGKLPSLRAFHLEEIHQCQELSPPTSFLLLHSATLTEFSWSLKQCPNWPTAPILLTYAETPLDIAFPELKKLSLNFTIFQDPTTDGRKIMEFVSRHAEQLTSLSLDGERFFEHKIRIQMFQLRTLEIALYHWITTSTFPALATHLPNLKTLTIKYGNFGMDVLDFPVMDSATALTNYLAKTTISDLFVERIRVPSVHNWQLHTLALERKSYQWDCSLEYVVLEVITENMPHLQFINGMERQDFLRLAHRRDIIQEGLRGPTLVRPSLGP